MSSSEDWDIATTKKSKSKPAAAKPAAAAKAPAKAAAAKPASAAKPAAAKPAAKRPPKAAKVDDGGLAAVAAREAARESEALLDSALLCGVLAAAKATAPRTLPLGRVLLAAGREGRDVVKSAAVRKNRHAPLAPPASALTSPSPQLPLPPARPAGSGGLRRQAGALALAASLREPELPRLARRAR